MDSETVPDHDLVKKCGDGDDEAFEMLYERYRLQLYSYLNKMLPGQAATVDDLYQQTWIRVLDNLATYREQQRFISWLFRIAHNLAVDHFRRESRFQSVDVDEHLEVPAGNPWDQIDHEELMAALDVAITELGPDQREVLLLRQQGMPFKEIAVLQKASINTVLGRMRYAIKRLQQLLRDRL